MNSISLFPYSLIIYISKCKVRLFVYIMFNSIHINSIKSLHQAILQITQNSMIKRMKLHQRDVINNIESTPILSTVESQDGDNITKSNTIDMEKSSLIKDIAPVDMTSIEIEGIQDINENNHLMNQALYAKWSELNIIQSKKFIEKPFLILNQETNNFEFKYNSIQSLELIASKYNMIISNSVVSL